MKAKIYFLAMAFVALLMVGCSDDDGIQLTQDEIIGDINTGKQVGIKGNSLVIYTTQGAYVNVQGAKGKISAQSSDEKVVTVTCIHETGQYGKDERISLSAIAVGKALLQHILLLKSNEKAIRLITSPAISFHSLISII